MNESRGMQLAKALLAKLILFLETLSSLILLIMMVLTFVDVIGRYLLNSPVYGASEMISALMALIIFTGLAITNATDNHIVVELFVGPIRKISPFIYDVIIQGFSIISMSLIFFVLFEIAKESYLEGSRTIVLEWPMFYIIGSITFFAGFSILSQVLGLLVGSSRPEIDSSKSI